jgi:hypothetical protein
MCFNYEASFLAWTLSYSIAYYLYNRNRNYDRWNAGFIIAFTTIQLLEAGLWYSITYRKEQTPFNPNDLLTRLILIALLSQPLIQSYMGAKYTQSTLLSLLCFVFLGMLIWGFWRIAKSKPGQFSSAPGPKGHLVWSDSAENRHAFLGNKLVVGLYLMGLFLPLLFMNNYKGYILIAVGITTAVASMLFADPREFGSYWCFTSVAYAIVAIFI